MICEASKKSSQLVDFLVQNSGKKIMVQVHDDLKFMFGYLFLVVCSIVLTFESSYRD
jgi:hypothetical protein